MVVDVVGVDACRTDPDLNALLDDATLAEAVETQRLFGKLAKAGLF